jgi:cyclohexyl-isocyanide hydratase
MQPRLKAGFLLFPDLTQLDFAAPYEVFARAPEVEVFAIAKTKGPVRSEFGLTFIADTGFAAAPQLDILCVPGGSGILGAAGDPDTMRFLQSQAEGARWVTAVCTGSLVLGAAGLLKGYRATTHWLSLDLLPLVGAIPEKARVVRGRNRVTSGGITAGIDFALYFLAEVFGRERAEAIALLMEYCPAPPFAAGDPDAADPALVREMRAVRAGLQEQRRAFFASLSAQKSEGRP